MKNKWFNILVSIFFIILGLITIGAFNKSNENEVTINTLNKIVKNTTSQTEKILCANIYDTEKPLQYSQETEITEEHTEPSITETILETTAIKTEVLTESSAITNYNNSDINNDRILFIGNSLIEGIRICNNTNHDFLSVSGISLEGLKSNIYNQISNYSCTTVIIGMGTNELGNYSETQFKNSYKDLISQIYLVNSNARIICMSIPPITNSRSFYDTLFNNNNVQIYNQYIQEICAENNLIYLDNTPFFGNVLNENWSSDGIHFNGYVYTDWYNFIISQIT